LAGWVSGRTYPFFPQIRIELALSVADLSSVTGIWAQFATQGGNMNFQYMFQVAQFNFKEN
jgi:hypothetical protein